MAARLCVQNQLVSNKTDKYISVAKEVEKVKEFSILKGTMLMVQDGDLVERVLN